MSRTSRYAFLQAKLAGMLARSYVGRNFRDLLRLTKVVELYDTLFPGERGERPAHELPAALEARIVSSGIDAMRSVLEMLPDAPLVLVHILRKQEYQSLKAVLRSMAANVPGGVATARGGQGAAPPRTWDLGPWAGVTLEGGKDPKDAIRRSPYAWVLPLLDTVPLFEIENRLDRDYNLRLVELARALPARDRVGVLRLARLQVALSNVTWALRLRFSFGMDEERARPLLVPGGGDAHRRALARLFEIGPDAGEDWRKWAYGWLLEDQLGESFTAPDPVRAEQKAEQRLYVRAHQLFHQNPFSLGPIAAWFALKEHEAALLATAVEAAALSLPEQEVLAMVGVP
jgi:vacuolar-type H+-ATPase subunit C/Vma6